MLDIWENNDVFRGMFFAGVGLLVLVILFIRHLRLRSFRLKAVGLTKATITNIRKRGKNGSVYRPVYEYYAEGYMRKVSSRWASSSIVAESGSEVDLYYVPGEPEKIYVPKEEKTNRVLIVFLSFISIAFIFLGTAVALGLME